MAKSKGKGSNEKDVIFRLGVETHPKTKQQLDQFGRQVQTMREQIAQLERSAARSISTEIERARKDIQDLRSLAGQASPVAPPPPMRSTAPPASPFVQPSVASMLRPTVPKLQTARDQADAARRPQLLDALNLRGNVEAEQKTTRELEAVYRSRQKIIAQFYADQRRQREQAEREEIRGLQATAREADRAAKEKSRSAAQAIRAEARELKDLEGIRDRSLKEAASNTDKFHSQVGQVAQGVAQFARGLGVLGIAGEENTAKLVQGLAKVQAGFDMVTGAVKTVRAVEKAMTAWKTATTAAATAQQASTMAAEKSATVSGTLTAALAAEKTAADAAAAAHARLAAARAAASSMRGRPGAPGQPGKPAGPGGPGIADTGMSVLQTAADVAYLARMARGARSAATVGRAGMAGAGIVSGGGMFGGLGGGSLAGAGGVGAAGAALAPAAAAVSAVLATIAGGVATHQMGRDIGRYGFMGGATHGSMSDRIGTGWATVGKWTGVASGLRESEGAVGRIQEANEKRRAEQEQRREMQQRELALQQQQWQEQDRVRQERDQDSGLQADRMTGMLGIRDARIDRFVSRQGQQFRPDRRAEQEQTALADALADLQGRQQTPQTRLQMDQIQRRLRDVAPTVVNPELQRQQYTGRLSLQAQGSQLQAAQQAASSMGAEVPEKIREAALQRVAGLHERMGGLLRDQAETEKSIAQQRLKGLDDAIGKTRDQIQLQRDAAKEQADRLKSAAERFGDLDPEQQRRLIQIKQRAERSGYGSLSRDDREALGSLGLERESSMLSQAALERARRAGFDRFFGESEHEKIRAARQAEQRLQVELRDKREMQVTIGQDVDELVRQVSNEVQTHMARRDRMLADQLRRQLAEDYARLQETRRRERAERVVAAY